MLWVWENTHLLASNSRVYCSTFTPHVVLKITWQYLTQNNQLIITKLTDDGVGFQWTGKGKNNWTLSFELLGRNIAPLNFKTERVAETALGASGFWPTFARFPGTWGIFSSSRDSKLTPYGLGFQWDGEKKNILNAHLRASGPKYSPT